MIKIFRLSREKYAKELSGVGASLFGGRWNSMGVEIIYIAESRALAMAEVMVHLSLATLPKDYLMVEIEIPNSIKIAGLNISDLPAEWNGFPPMKALQTIGDSFIYNGGFCIIKVPSAIVNGHFNYLINPRHLDFKEIKIISITQFPFDKRIFR